MKATYLEQRTFWGDSFRVLFYFDLQEIYFHTVEVEKWVQERS